MNRMTALNKLLLPRLILVRMSSRLLPALVLAAFALAVARCWRRARWAAGRDPRSRPPACSQLPSPQRSASSVSSRVVLTASPPAQRNSDEVD